MAGSVTGTPLAIVIALLILAGGLLGWLVLRG
jgi:hypothetical protein